MKPFVLASPRPVSTAGRAVVASRHLADSPTFMLLKQTLLSSKLLDQVFRECVIIQSLIMNIVFYSGLFLISQE